RLRSGERSGRDRRRRRRAPGRAPLPDRRARAVPRRANGVEEARLGSGHQHDGARGAGARRALKRAVLVALAACGVKEGPRTAPPAPEPADAAVALDARAPDAAAPPDASPTIGWLRGSTHVHALPSGDSETPVADVVRWYEDHGYDFIVLTDHNKVTLAAPGVA